MHRLPLQGATLAAAFGLAAWGTLRRRPGRVWLVALLTLVGLTVLVTKPQTATRLAGEAGVAVPNLVLGVGVKGDPSERRRFLVEAELAEDGGVDVGDIVPVFDGVEAQLVGGAVDDAAPDAGAGEPDGEAVRVVVAAVLAAAALLQSTLARKSVVAAEASENDAAIG